MEASALIPPTFFAFVVIGPAQLPIAEAMPGFPLPE
jgi:hypothetical protein